MIDQYGRTIEYLRISVTDRCNLRCVYCMPEEGIEQLPHEQILTFDEIERVCRISTELGISKIKLTGGEPLVRKGLPDLLGKIKRIPGIEQVTLTTNGILLKNQLDELMRQGLDAVNISIDTLDETCYHTVTRCGELNQALEGLQAALEYPNLRVKLNCVPMNQSEEEYIQMAEYAKEHHFDYFTTTLSVSPHKNAAKLNEIGLRLAQEYGIPYLVSDFKKKGGYLKSIELSAEYQLYRQDYCGCVYSKAAREREKQQKILQL